MIIKLAGASLRRTIILRPIIAFSLLGVAVGSVLAAAVVLAQAEESASAISIDNFSFTPATLTVRAGTDNGQQRYAVIAASATATWTVATW